MSWPIFWMGFNCITAAEPLQGDNLLFKTKFPELPGANLIDLKGWKTESILEPSSGLEYGTPRLESGALTTRPNSPNFPASPTNRNFKSSAYPDGCVVPPIVNNIFLISLFLQIFLDHIKLKNMESGNQGHDFRVLISWKQMLRFDIFLEFWFAVVSLEGAKSWKSSSIPSFIS